MKKSLLSFFIILQIIMLILTSCSMEKRVYMYGYHTLWKNWKQSSTIQELVEKGNVKNEEQNKIQIEDSANSIYKSLIASTDNSIALVPLSALTGKDKFRENNENNPVKKINVKAVEHYGKRDSILGSQEDTVIISPLVGEVIDSAEKVQHGIFPYYSNQKYISAVFIRTSDSTIILRATLKGDSISERKIYSQEFEWIKTRIDGLSQSELSKNKQIRRNHSRLGIGILLFFGLIIIVLIIVLIINSINNLNINWGF